MWTPADWAWAGGLLNAMLPSLHHGIAVVARKFEKFDPEEAYRLLQDLGIRNTFVPPTALRMLRAVDNPRGRFDLNLRTIASAGEALGAETLAWGREALGLTINEAYGQTECNLVLGSCGAMGLVRPALSARRCRDTTWRSFDRTERSVRRENWADRRAPARPGDVPRLLEPSRGHRREVHRRMDDDGRPGRGGCRRLRPFRRPR